MCERCAVFPGRLVEAAKRHKVAVVYSNREPFEEWKKRFGTYGLDVTLFPVKFDGARRILATRPQLVVLDDQTYRLPLVDELKKRNIGYAVASGNFDIAEEVLDSGAEQFLALPMNSRLALSYMRAVIARRRPILVSKEELKPIKIGDVNVDFKGRALTRDGVDLRIKLRAWKLLELFVDNPGRVIGKKELEQVVDGEYPLVSDVISNLRRAFEKDPKDPQHFITVWNVGYKFVNGASSQ